MKSFIAAALLFLQSDATQEETSLMQGPVARRGQMTPEATSDKDTTAKLMATATKMLKTGATPDVVGFIEATINNVNQNVLGVIVDEHHQNQQTIDNLLARFDVLVEAKQACQASIQLQHSGREASSYDHKLCRSQESLDCARSRKCEEELEVLWSRVQHEEEEMRRIHWSIHGEWCVENPVDHPVLDDPFHWADSVYWEGDETSQSVRGGRVDDQWRGPEDTYPPVDLTADVIEFRRFSVDYFGQYILQLPPVDEAWEQYNQKLLQCAALEEVWTLKVPECDALQTTLHEEACGQSLNSRQCASDFGHEYRYLSILYANEVRRIQQLEYDRKREWETLHIVTCLLETVYTHVIHAIDSGEPCPTTESHPEQIVAEINTCHIVEESMTTNLTIVYGAPPQMAEIPEVEEAPCTAQYIWDETGAFPLNIQSSHTQTIEDEGLETYFTALSGYGWAGCAAPQACVECERRDIVVNSDYTGHQECMEHQVNLRAGQMDWHTFKCLSGDQCIQADGRCNGRHNCDDGSDELGCVTAWGAPAVLGTQPCREPFVSDVQFQCADQICIDVAARCNGVNNCADGSDEDGCEANTATGLIRGLTVEPMTGFTATFEIPTLETTATPASAVFSDRTYTFDSLGSFTGYSFIKMSNEDKHIRDSHVQMKLRLPKPQIIYVAKLDGTELPWLQAEGWTLTALDGISYHGVQRETKHTEWATRHDWANYPRGTLHEENYNPRRMGDLHEEHYGPGEVWQKTFTAGAVEMRGNNGGDGSYVIFVANPALAQECDRSATSTKGGGIHMQGVADGADAIQFIDLGAGAMTSEGRMTSVKYRVARANQHGLKFQIYRPVSGNIYTLVTESEELTNPDLHSETAHRLLTPLEYQAGDYIGWVHTGQGTFNFHHNGGDVRWKYGIEPVGSVIDFSDGGPRVYSYEATMDSC